MACIQTSHDISKCPSLDLLRPKQRAVFARKVGATQVDQTVNKQKRNKESLFVRSISGPLAMETKGQQTFSNECLTSCEP